MVFYSEALRDWEIGAGALPAQCLLRSHKGRCQLVEFHGGVCNPNPDVQSIPLPES